MRYRSPPQYSGMVVRTGRWLEVSASSSGRRPLDLITPFSLSDRANMLCRHMARAVLVIQPGHASAVISSRRDSTWRFSRKQRIRGVLSATSTILAAQGPRLQLSASAAMVAPQLEASPPAMHLCLALKPRHMLDYFRLYIDIGQNTLARIPVSLSPPRFTEHHAGAVGHTALVADFSL